jgi:hypothetical protein
MPIPTGHVKKTTSATLGASARATPKTPIRMTDQVIAERVPIRALRYAAGGANSPMHSTGMVARRPTTACVVCRPSWISGRSGPTPTI